MVNEFRKDIVSGDWVLISSSRARRPHDTRRQRLNDEIDTCPFEPQRMSENAVPSALYYRGERVAWTGDWDASWTTLVMPNQFPAVEAGPSGTPHAVGPFQVCAARGFHDLIITRDHTRSMAQFTPEETAEVLRAYQDRYREIAASGIGAYVSIIHNHGHDAGASIYHNHSQIFSTPMIPPKVLRSLESAERYQRETGDLLHSKLIAWEQAQGTRVIYENDEYIALCPFASKTGYEVRIYPKMQQPRFEEVSAGSLVLCGDALARVLRMMFVALDDVDYNFFIHTAPVAVDPVIDGALYHWHIEITPRVAMTAGFEISTDLFVNAFDPDDCAATLRAAS